MQYLVKQNCCHCSRTCEGGEDKQWFGKFHLCKYFDFWTVSVKLISKANNNEVKTTPSGSLAGYAEHCKW